MAWWRTDYIAALTDHQVFPIAGFFQTHFYVTLPPRKKKSHKSVSHFIGLPKRLYQGMLGMSSILSSGSRPSKHSTVLTVHSFKFRFRREEGKREEKLF